MIFRHSIRQRIILAYSIFGVVLSIVFGCVVYVSLDYIDDNLVNTSLVHEMDRLGTQYNEYIDTLIPISPNISVFQGTAAMPAFVLELVDGIGEGIHERYYEKVEYHVAAKSVPNRIAPLYLIYDVSSLEFMESRHVQIGAVLAASCVLVVALGIWIGLLTSQQVIAPVAYLSDQVDRWGPGSLPTDLAEKFCKDEVGILAQALEEASRRIEAFVQREQEFTRDTSHELRTPVTVIKGAAELLKRRTDASDERIRNPLLRIERAVTNMEHIINNLLWLAREENHEFRETCAAAAVIQESIEQLEQVMSNKPISVIINQKADPILQAPAPIFRITFVNLIQNAFRHTTHGEIRIEILDDRIVIADSGEGIDECDVDKLTAPHVRGLSSTGFGLGLTIVERLCTRFGWRFELDSEIGCGTTATLFFNTGLPYDPAEATNLTGFEKLPQKNPQ
jgi:signal transduction histidine kinase